MSEYPNKDPRPAARPINPIPEAPQSYRDLDNSAGLASSNEGGVPIAKKPWRPGCFSIGFGILLALIIGGMIAGGGDDSNTGALVVACQNVVKKNLKSPSTANFVGVPKSDGKYIRGEVDAENSFGATLRNSFQCTIIDDQTVRLDYIR